MSRRKALLGIFAVVAAIAAAPPARAGGGGHCPPDDYALRARGNAATVALEQACFKPRVLFVDPGTEVTFVNRDGMLHNIAGPSGTFAYGFQNLRPGRSKTFLLQDEGVFPYMCYLHPGMAGAIVVGDGASGPIAVGAAAMSATSADSATRLEKASSTPPLLLGLGIATVLLTGAIGALARRRAPARA